MNKIKHLILAAWHIFIIFAAVKAMAADYTIELLPGMNPSYTVVGNTYISDYDNDGVPVGYSYSGTANLLSSAFYGTTPIAYPGAANNRAEGVNSFGVVAGWSQVPTKPFLGARSPKITIGWLWSKTAGFYKTYNYRIVTDVNDSGTVVTMDGTVIYPGGLSETLPRAVNTCGTWIYDINGNGDIYGNVRTSCTAYTYTGIIYRAK